MLKVKQNKTQEKLPGHFHIPGSVFKLQGRPALAPAEASVRTLLWAACRLPSVGDGGGLFATSVSRSTSLQCLL